MGLDVLDTPQQAASAVRRALGLNESCQSSESRFEVLRATVWSMAAPASKAHVNRVLGAALPTWQLLSGRAAATEEALRTDLREALSTLEDAGDLLQLRGGYWAPATARFVELPDAAGYLLVGGAPSALLLVNRDAVRYHGPHRHFAEVPSEVATSLPLEDWARHVFSSLERQNYSPTSTDAFAFYLPAGSRPGAPRFTRWSDSAGDSSGTLLARRTRLYGAREYRLVDVRAGRIVGACEVQGDDALRLMYALDLAAKNPIRARRRRVGEQTEWLFTTALPRAEQRAFAAFGTLTIPDDRPFERRWTFVRNEELALRMLRSLGIALEHARED